jgi:hypothetical protein
VSTGCSGVLIRGNTSFHNFREYVRAATGIDVRSPDGTVIDNLTYDNEDSGIQIYPGGHRAVVVNNVSYNNGDHGIDVLNSTDVVVVSNTVYKNVTAGINLEGASGTAASQRGTVRNNISVDNGLTSTTTKGDIRVDAASAPGTTLNYDLLHLSTSGTVITWGTTQYSSLAAMRSATGQEAAGIQADPRWTDASTGNFRLRSGSPAIDSADSGAVNQQAYDAEGQARIDDPAVPDTGTGRVRLLRPGTDPDRLVHLQLRRRHPRHRAADIGARRAQLPERRRLHRDRHGHRHRGNPGNRNRGRACDHPEQPADRCTDPDPVAGHRAADADR